MQQCALHAGMPSMAHLLTCHVPSLTSRSCMHTSIHVYTHICMQAYTSAACLLRSTMLLQDVESDALRRELFKDHMEGLKRRK